MSNPIPQVFDTGKRVLRTLVQVGIPAFLALGAALPVVLQQAHVLLKPELYGLLLACAGGITATAGILTRIMAIPAVNDFLGTVGLSGHSGNLAAADTYTAMIALPRPGTLDSTH